MKEFLTLVGFGQNAWTSSLSGNCPRRTKFSSRQFLVNFILITILSQSWGILAQVTEGDYEEGTTDESVIKSDFFPTVNKCCPIDKSYKENSGCVDATAKERMVVDNIDHVWKPKVITKDIIEDPVVFRLNVSRPECSRGYIERIIMKDTFTMDHRDFDGDVEDHGSQTVFLISDGSLIWFDDKGFYNTHRSTNFCIDKVNETTFIAVICRPACNEKEPCIRKCCASDSIFDEKNATCVPSRKTWRPHFLTTESDQEKEVENYPHYIVGLPKCIDMYSIPWNGSERFYPLLDGSLLLINDEKNVTFTKGFCIDGKVDYENSSDFSSEIPFNENMIHFSGLRKDQIAIICFSEEEEDIWLYPLFASFMFISSFFLILTAVVYLILWEYKNIHGWLQFAYVVTLCFAFTSLAILQLWSEDIREYSIDLCQLMGSLIHFSFLSAFFWLTSMNFDLWWTFSGCRPLRTSTRTGERFRFTLFSLFSWGIPMIIAGIGTVLDFMYRNDKNFMGTRPKFEYKCYFFASNEQLPYFYAPVGVLLCINCVFFFSTIISLHKLQKDTKFATRQSSNQDKKKFVLFMKLFVVSGILWVFEVISWVVINYSQGGERFLKRIFIPTDLINALQGLAIFIIFICKPKTCKLLEGQFKKVSDHIEAKKERAQEERGPNKSIVRKVLGSLIVGFYSIFLLPVVYGLIKMFSMCTRTRRSLDSRKFSQNTVISTFDKSQRLSDCSASTTFSSMSMGLELEMNQRDSLPHIYTNTDTT